MRHADAIQNATEQSGLKGERLPGRGLGFKFVLLIASTVASLIVLEIGLRLFSKTLVVLPQDAANLGYRYDAELGWFPVPGSWTRINASRPIMAKHNSDGFRGPERVANNKPVIVFLGDSLVWGFDVEAPERFTEDLQVKHPEWAIYNFGVSGYGTDQEYLLLKNYYDKYRPRLVFLIICGDNDNEDNASNVRGGYYKPCFRLEQGQLRLQGVPVPKSEKTFLAQHGILSRSFILRALVHLYYTHNSPRPIKNQEPPTGAILLELRQYVIERGGSFAVGLQHANNELEQFLRRFQIPWADLTTRNPAHTYPEFGNHWTPEGHKFVAEQIELFLRGHRDLIDANDSPRR